MKAVAVALSASFVLLTILQAQAQTKTCYQTKVGNSWVIQCY